MNIVILTCFPYTVKLLSVVLIYEIANTIYICTYVRIDIDFPRKRKKKNRIGYFEFDTRKICLVIFDRNLVSEQHLVDIQSAILHPRAERIGVKSRNPSNIDLGEAGRGNATSWQVEQVYVHVYVWRVMRHEYYYVFCICCEAEVRHGTGNLISQNAKKQRVTRSGFLY